MIRSINENKKYLLLSTILLMIFVIPLENAIPLFASAEPKAKSESVDDTNSTSAHDNIQRSDVPVAKMVYKNKSYEMAPFVVVENENLKRLNFPQLPDDSQPIAQISQGENISFSFLTKPREINAFFVDYDADTTEMTPLHRVGKSQFSFGDVYGPNTLELRVIYPDGKYVTYTCLIEVKKPELKDLDLGSGNNGIMNSNDNLYTNLKSNDPDSSSFGQVSPTEKQVLNQFDKRVNVGNVEKQGAQPSPDFLKNDESTNSCEYNEIPIVDIQTEADNNTNSHVNVSKSDAKPRWATLDLGKEQNICGLKVSFANVNNEIKFFTLEFSNDGKKYTTAEYYSSTGTNSPSEIYDLKEGPIKARFIKITELDVTESIQWISDLIVLGKTAL